MFNDVKDAIAYIESKRTKRTFFDFSNILKKYNIPTQLNHVIHIAGTNGKGSTTIFIRDLLMKQGYRVGTFTSPYIINHNERISVNKNPIDDHTLLNIINELYDMIETENLSMFEIDVCIMLVYFNRLNLDYHIIECGIGGLRDKTNVLTGDVSIITNIGYDHQFMLGDTLLEIASHKAGIIKENKVLFTTETNKDILDYFKKECDIKKTSFYPVKVNTTDYPYHIIWNKKDYVLHLPYYQVYNLALAIHVVDYLLKDIKGLQEVIDEFSWPCRFEKVKDIYLDGAHNIDGIKALLTSIQKQNIQDPGIVFSALVDKDVNNMLELLKDYDILEASFDDERSSHDHMHFIDAINKMKEKHETVIVTGSLHFVSAVRKYLKGE